MITYLQSGDTPTAAHWNEIFAAVDIVLGDALGGLSALFAKVGIWSPTGDLMFADKQWDRGFFFGFDPKDLPAGSLHPLALAYLNNYLANVQPSQNALFWRQYDHTAITGQLTGLAQLSNTAKWKVVKLDLPAWSAWSAVIYPSGFAGLPYTDQGVKQTISSTDYPAYNCLDVSLQVHTAAVGGVPYQVTFDTVLNAEHEQPLKGIDVFMLGNVTWDTTNWNKYAIVRAHNCGRTAATIFGTSINPGASRCFRKIGGTWTAQGNYFHWMQSGDGRFIQMRESFNPSGYGPGAPSIFQLAIVADVLAAVLRAGVGSISKLPDLAKFFDMAPVYNSASYAKQTSFENAPPPKGYFPVLSGDVPVGDFIIPRGKFLVANRAVPNTVHATQSIVAAAASFTFEDGFNTVENVSAMAVYNVTTSQSIPQEGTPGDPLTANWSVNYSIKQFAIIPQAGYIAADDVLQITFDYIPPDDHVWVSFDSFATLAADLAAVGLASRSLSETNPRGGTLSNLEIYSAAAWHLIDLSCPLVTFLTGGVAPLPAAIVGATQGGTPPSLKLPWLAFSATTVVASPTSNISSYKTWSLDGSGNPVVGTTVDVTVTNDGGTPDSARNVFLPTDLISTIKTWIQTQSEAGGVLSLANFQVYSTTFGHVLAWEEIWPLDAKFTGVYQLYGPDTSGLVGRTIKVIYDAAVGLRVTQAIVLNETKYYTTASWTNDDDPAPWENGIFPPIGGFGGLWSARRFMAWHYARVDRQFQNARWFEHLAADSAWLPDTGWSNQKLPTPPWGGGLDELSLNEFNNVVSFYEATPIGVDAVGSASARAKAGISRMGTFSRTPDIWSPFAYWLAGAGSLAYPTGGGAGSISTGRGWYYANTSSVMANATIGDPVPNMQPCQMEHYNTIASLVNGLPAFRYTVAQYGATAFSLDFSAANIIIVNGGSGHNVGDALNFNLKVASIDGAGAITSVAQNGSVVVNTYDAYSTPARPFALSPGTATCDTTSGDGSALTFIPEYAPIGVQIPGAGTSPTDSNYSYLQSTDFYQSVKFFPRTAYFAWHGATAGGADPVGDYLAGLGMTVQSTLPDSYGNSLLNKYGSYTAGVYGTHDGSAGDWLQGFSADFQIAAQTYRWVTIADAKTLYASLSLPFVLDENFAPMSFQVVESSQDAVDEGNIGSSTKIHELSLATINSSGFFPPPYYGADFGGYAGTGNLIAWSGSIIGTICGVIDVDVGDGSASAWWGFPTSYPANKYSPPPSLNASWYWGGTCQVDRYQDIPAAVTVNTSFDIADFGIKAAEFLNDAAGAWLCDTGIATLSSDQFLVNLWKKLDSGRIGDVNEDVVTITGSLSVGGLSVDILLWEQWRVTHRTRYEDNWGILNAVKFGTQNSPLKARAYLLEGVPSRLVAALPKNYAYADPTFVAVLGQAAAYLALGTQVLPIIADNTVESSSADVLVLGNGDNVMTTSLPYARIIYIPVDG